MINAKEARERSLLHEKHLKSEIDHIEKVIFREIEKGCLSTVIVLPDKDIWSSDSTKRLIRELESHGYKVYMPFLRKSNKIHISWEGK